MNRHAFISLSLLLVSLFLSGCQAELFSPSIQELPLSVPENWSESAALENKPGSWLDSFRDAELQALIDEALLGNFSLKVTAARIAAAQARARQAGAAVLPTVELEGSAVRRKSSGTISNNFSLIGNVRWEVDLWHRLSNREQAAVSELEASTADYQAARLSLAAGIARAWFQLLEAAGQVRLAQQTLVSYQQSLQVVEEQYRRGLTSALDVRLTRAALSNAEASLAAQARQHAHAQRLLEQLLGRYPAGLINGDSRLPELSGPVPAGLPSGLLERRPDLRAARLRWQATLLRAQAAERNWLPDFALTSSAGTASERLYQLLDWDQLIWSLGISLSQSLFDGGQNDAERQLARADVEQQLNNYAEEVLSAFREVEETLSADVTLARQEAALQVAVSEAEEARALAEQRYRQGLEGIITLLETQRRSFVARSNSLNLRRQRLENRINLHLALAGPLEIAIPEPAAMESP